MTLTTTPLTAIAPAQPNAPTAADAHAAANLAANVEALRGTQPGLIGQLPSLDAGLTWTYGRDGALTARDAQGMWWAGCSVPRAASRVLLKTLDAGSSTACFLRPFHAGAVRAALDVLRPQQALIAIVPDPTELAVMLRCEDFAADIRRHRLWLVGGTDWEQRLDELLTAEPGLPTPTQFIRLQDGNVEAAEALVEPAQRVISKHVNDRARRATVLKCRQNIGAPSAQRAGRTRYVSPSHFRLWDDAGHVLGQIACQAGQPVFDADDPRRASTLALAEAVSTCDAVVAPNLGRADAASVAPLDVAWVTWATTKRFPPVDPAAPRDRLVIADPSWHDAAIAAGWPVERVHVAGWPTLVDATAVPGGNDVVVIDDTRSLQPPKGVVEMSSHRLLWDLIRDELLANPFAVGVSVLTYLDRWMRQSGIAPEALDRRRFVEELIVPAYAQGVVHTLLKAGVPLRVYGRGWTGRVPDAVVAGAVETRDAFEAAVRSAACLLHVWPVDDAHPIHHCGRPVVRRCRSRDDLLRTARLALATAGATTEHATVPPLSADLLRGFLN